ncbi:flavin reductase family protein [Sulfurospirillum sp. 1612]|uniref:flavin reductase family protein n=1 Tax=Sulfurospirillum sp. 1612 TaxID=3094835 RepID=UPI002F91FADD
MLIDFDENTDAYRLMRQAVIPRPIAWIVTEDHVVNIAPFSYFMALTSTPATMIVSIGHKRNGEPKDTLKNIRKTKKCTICIPQDNQLEMMHFSSKELDEETSEATLFDIPLEKKFQNYPSMIQGAPVAFFCELYQELDIKGSAHKPLIVEIKHMYLEDAYITNKEKMHFEFPAIARIGGDYAHLGVTIKAPIIP